MKQNRPVNLSLTTVNFPITAIASILHRISAVVVWLGLGIVLASVGCAMSSPENFQAMQALLSTSCFAQFTLWGLLTAFTYYAAATVKHIIQDMGFFESFAGGKITSWAAIFVGVVAAIWAGVSIWL